MSLLDELLVVVDDQTELRLDRLETLVSNYSRQPIIAGVGRLAGRGLVEKVERNGFIFVRLTERGNKYIERTLASIHRAENSWPGNWFCVTLITPDVLRRQRDLFRYYLIEMGFGRLIDGCWIYPWNRQEELAELVRKFPIGQYVITYETQSLGRATNQIIVQKSWPWPTLQRRLDEFCTTAAATLTNLEKKKSSDDATTITTRLEAKKTIFSLGTILAADPTLPIDYVPNRPLYQRAYDLYQHIRPYCYR